MECRRCGQKLERPGDYCLACDTANADAVVVAADRDRATVTILDGEDVLGEAIVTTTPEDDAERRSVELRNFAGRVADEVRRKRPEEVYVAGDRDVVAALRADLHHDVYRVTTDDPVDAAVGRRGENALATVDAAPVEKIGGSHSTLIAGRTGHEVITTVAAHPNVKKVVPGPIESGGGGSRGGVRAKVTRSDTGGNVRLLLRDGSSVQEVRVVTTAPGREDGERIRADLNDVLEDAGFGG